ncbi:MAG: hypothetical protein Q8930_14800 [Bacillota bacterium]|nr:hypothetical protein [Bacillota bacterium]
MSEFSSFSPEELSILAESTALSIAKERTAVEINVLGNFVAAVGGLLLAIAAQMVALQATQDKLDQITLLKNQIKGIEKQLENGC